ncbi:MAG: bifunctional methylenetetrahydrofolate dehydrogenase/methenyltetrahydrofolate cyclohydrolase FolD [Clostridiales bacterium]|nr:bifunctional methylenetetrahydrofolate dehydrogenase/methenyltetrahydrofolate cyclohydrolase FolD [Clostridiales bacterium]
MSKIIDGKSIRDKELKLYKNRVDELKANGLLPCLAVILVGNDPASRVYVNNKKKACENVGIKSLEFALPEETSESEVINLVKTLNRDIGVHGILCQLPLPGHIDKEKVINTISPMKDVDCFHPENVGKLFLGKSHFVPCTPMGIMTMLKYEGIDVSGKHCVIIGRSDIVGKPMALLMLQSNATVTVCHSKTSNLSSYTKQADILVSAVGKAKFVKKDMVKSGAVVIDVGMNKDETGKLCGDIDFDEVKDICSVITPVPGGVGPMTITMLIKNTITAAQAQIN